METYDGRLRHRYTVRKSLPEMVALHSKSVVQDDKQLHPEWPPDRNRARMRTWIDDACYLVGSVQWSGSCWSH